jgi:ribosomal protein L17
LFRWELREIYMDRLGFVNSFFQVPETIIRQFKDVAVGQVFEYIGIEYLKVEGGYQRIGPGRKWSVPRTLADNTPVRL